MNGGGGGGGEDVTLPLHGIGCLLTPRLSPDVKPNAPLGHLRSRGLQNPRGWRPLLTSFTFWIWIS